jgi:hypothetical protein
MQHKQRWRRKQPFFLSFQQSTNDQANNEGVVSPSRVPFIGIIITEKKIERGAMP